MLAVLGLVGGVPAPGSAGAGAASASNAQPAFDRFRESFERFRAIAAGNTDIGALPTSVSATTTNATTGAAGTAALAAARAQVLEAARVEADAVSKLESQADQVKPNVGAAPATEKETAPAGADKIEKAVVAEAPAVDTAPAKTEPVASASPSTSPEAVAEKEEAVAETKEVVADKKEAVAEVQATQKKTKAADAITLVILSDRELPLQAAIGSVVLTTDAALDIWVLGDKVDTLEATLKDVVPFKSNQVLNVLSMDAAQEEIKDMNPSWMRPKAGESINNPAWRTNLTILQEEWDHDSMHHTRFNLMRFYLAHLSMFSEVDSILFMDDDVILKDDISLLAKAPIPEDIVVVGQCDGFSWQDDCHKYDSFSRGSDWSENSATLYLSEKDAENAPTCEFAEGKCGAPLDVYTKVLEDLSKEQRGSKIDFVAQPVWNFGLVYMSLKGWRDQDVTGMYDWWLDKNEELHIFPEDSLSFGLGVPYLALADKVACWNDYLSKPTRDGLGYITMADLMVQGVDDIEAYLNDAVFVHYSGRRKPWSKPTSQDPLLEAELAKPFLDVMDALGLPPPPAPPAPLPRIKALFVTEPRSGSEWFMDTIDAHPQVCASGEREFPTNGFAREALIPSHYAGLQFSDCAVKKGCQWGFIAQYVPMYISNYATLCPTGSMNGVSPELVESHGMRLCKWADAWKTKYGELDPVKGTNATDKLWKMYDSETFDDDSDLSPCSCRGKQVQMLKFMRGWAGDDAAGRASYPATDYYNGHFNSFIDMDGSKVYGPELKLEEYKVVEFIRNNTFDQCLSLAFASATNIWHENDLGSDDDKMNQAVVVNSTWMNSCINHVEKTRKSGELTKIIAPLKAAGKVLTLYYEQCDDDPSQCLDLATTFLTSPDLKASDLPPVSEFESDECADDWDFTDKSGNGCFVWDNFDCTNEVGSRCDYSTKEMDEIRKMCPVSCGSCSETDSPTIHGDPIFKYGEKAVKFTLNKNKLTSLMKWTSAKGDEMELFGMTYGKGGTQWFKRFNVESNGKDVLNVNVVRKRGKSMMRTKLDGEVVEAPSFNPRSTSLHQHESKDKAVKISAGGFWDSPKSRSGKEINIVAGDVSLRIRSSMAKKSPVHKIGDNSMHLNVKVTSKLPATSRGFFAELAGVQPLSSASKAHMSYTYKKTAAQKKAATALSSIQSAAGKKDMSCPARYTEPTASTLPPLPEPDEDDGVTTVDVSMTVAGDVSDFDAAAQSSLVSNMAETLNVPVADVSLTITAAGASVSLSANGRDGTHGGSGVSLLFVVAVADATAAQAVESQADAALPTASAASAALGVSVETAPVAATVQAAASSYSPTIHGDPIFKYGEKAVKFTLNKNKLTSLMKWTSAKGDEMELFGMTYGKGGTQWFKRFNVKSNGKDVLNVNVVRKRGKSMMRTKLDGEVVAAPSFNPRSTSLHQHESKDKAVKISAGGFWDSPKSRSGKEINIVAGDVSLRIRSSMAKKSPVHKIGVNSMHLNVKVTSKLPATSRGFFAELAGVQPLSSASKAHMSYTYKKTAAQKKAATALPSTQSAAGKKDMSCPARYNEPTASTLPPLPEPDEDDGDEIDNGPSPPFSGSGGNRAARSSKESTLIDLESHSAYVVKGDGDGSTIKKSGIDAEGEAPFERIANEKEFTHSLFRDGHLWRVKHTMYYFTWADSASGGEEIAAYLARLPQHFIAPGSSTTGPFDYEAFQRSSKQVDARDHAIVAFGQGSASEFYETVKAKGMSKRVFLPMTIARDTLSHRLALQEMANTATVEKGEEPAFLQLDDTETAQDWQMRHLLDSAYDECVDNCTTKRLDAAEKPISKDKALQKVMQSFGMVASPKNPVAALCLMGKLSGLPIEFDKYGSEGKYNAPRTMVSEKTLLKKSEEHIAKIMRENAREALMVAKLHDHFEALAEKHGCLFSGPGKADTRVDHNKELNLKAAKASDDALQPLYYFMSAPKQGGEPLASMLASLPSEYVLPGSQLSAPFDFAALQKEAKGLDERKTPIVAFGHSGRSFLQQLHALRVTKRPVVLLGVVRDTLLHRVSYFDQYIMQGSNHTQDLGGDKHAEKEMTSWVRSFRYPANAQMQPFLGLESTWKNKSVGAMFQDLMDSKFDEFRSESKMDLRMGVLGSQSNLRATACTFAKMTNLPIKWDTVGERKMEDWERASRTSKNRASLMIKSFNDTTAVTMLSRDAREVAFVALAESRFESLAAKHGCMPASDMPTPKAAEMAAVDPAPPAEQPVSAHDSSSKCSKVPSGKKLAVAAVWVDMTNNSAVSRMTHDNCKTMLALLQARAALTQDKMCFKKEDVKMVLLTDFARMPQEERTMYEQNGVTLRDAASDTSAMRDFAKKMDMKGDARSSLSRVLMLKLAAFWETSYSAIVLIDTDVILGQKQPLDMFNVLLSPGAPSMIYRAGNDSPINAGLVGIRPQWNHYKSFLAAVSSGFDEKKGWGGKYSAAGLASLQRFSTKLAQNNFAHNSNCNGPWCFIGRDQDQGMLAHLLADEEHPIQSMPLDASVNYGKHYAFKPKPWYVSEYEKQLAGKKNTMSTWQLKSQLGEYWDEYRGTYQQAWDAMPIDKSASCRAMFACGYAKATKVLPELANVADNEQDAHDSLMSAGKDCEEEEKFEEEELAAPEVDDVMPEAEEKPKGEEEPKAEEAPKAEEEPKAEEAEQEPQAEEEPEGALQPTGVALAATKKDAERAEAAAARKAAAEKRHEEATARKAEAEARRVEASKKREEASAARVAAAEAKEAEKKTAAEKKTEEKPQVTTEVPKVDLSKKTNVLDLDAVTSTRCSDLLEMLDSLALAESASAAQSWCEKQGADSLAEIKEAAAEKDLVETLGLKPIKAKLLLSRIAKYEIQ